MTDSPSAATEMARTPANTALIIARLVVSQLASNCYLVTCRATGELIVIDAGDDGARILAAIAEATGGGNRRVKLIVNTHGHFDHTAAIADLRTALGPVPVLMHAADIELVEGNGPGARKFLGHDYVPVLPDRTLREGDEVRWGDCALRVIETPGHSPGGICLYGHGVVFSGDSLFRRGVGAWHFFKGDKAALLGSLREKVLTLPPETVVYPGHGEATTIGEEQSENPYFQKRGR
jgi:hydroxyacylglutathione hydrolase